MLFILEIIAWYCIVTKDTSKICESQSNCNLIKKLALDSAKNNFYVKECQNEKLLDYIDNA